MTSRHKQRTEICRICRQKCSSCFDLSGKLEGFQDLTIDKALQVCCGVKYEKADEFPWRICDLCVDELKITYIFLEKFRESEKFYNDQIASKQVDEIEKIEFLDGYEQEVINSNGEWDEIPIEETLVPEEDTLAISIKDIAGKSDSFVYKGITIKKPSKKQKAEDRDYVPSTRPRRSTVSKKTYIEYEVSTPETDVEEPEDTDFVVSGNEEASETEEVQPPPEEESSAKKRSRSRKDKSSIPFIHQKQPDLDNELEGDFAVEVDGKIMYKCNKCEKIFPKLGSLRSHIKFVHLKIREWLCSMCRKFVLAYL